MDFKNKEFTSTCAYAISRAVDETKENAFEFLCVDLVVLNILEFTPMGEVFAKKMNIDLVNLRSLVMAFMDSHIPKSAEKDYEPMISDGTQSLLQSAYCNKKAIDKNAIIAPLDIIFALFSPLNIYDSFIRSHFEVNNISAEKVRSYIMGVGGSVGKSSEGVSPAQKTEKKTFIEKFTINLNDLAKEGKINRLQGRVEILKSIVITLGQKHKSSPLIVGEPGVGKTAIVEGLARAIALNEPFIDNMEIPHSVKDLQILRVNITAMMAGTKFRGDFEDRMNGLAEEVSANGNLLLFFDEMQSLVNLGSTSGSVDAVSILKPYIENGMIKVIGTVNNKDYRAIVEKSSLSRLFKVISLDPASKEHTFNIVNGLKESLEKHHKVSFNDDAVNEVIKLTDKFLTNLNFPDKAISVIDMALSKASVFAKKVVDISDIRDVISTEYNIPINTLGDKDELDKIKFLSSNLKKKVFGQEGAIDKITDYIIMNRAQLSLKDKPLASFLLAGPTGVGKTEVCKQLANELSVPLIRFDMSEYKEKQSVAKFIGAAPGYIGYEDGGLLVEAISKNPNSVLLLDEIEKAHPEILDVLLQVLDYAVLTDNFGRKANFKNVSIFMTSNLGHSEMMESAKIGFSGGFGGEEDDADRLGIIKKYFKPEFVNRLDGVIVFSSISVEVAEKVAQKQLNQVVQNLKERDIALTFDKTVLDYVVSGGFDEKFGGRNIERFIESKILQPLAREILFNSLEGNRVTVSLLDGNVVCIKEDVKIIKIPVKTKVVKKPASEKSASKTPAKKRVKKETVEI